MEKFNWVIITILSLLTAQCYWQRGYVKYENGAAVCWKSGCDKLNGGK